MTTAQLQTLKTFIANDGALNAFPNNTDTAIDIAALLNAAASPTFHVYRSNIPVQEIFDQITWANMTPNDAPDGTQAWLNRATACQGKQFNLQTLLMGQEQINAARVKVRDGLQDALSNVPSGASGATVSGGWSLLRDNVLARVASKFEKIFAVTSGAFDGSTPAKAASMGVEGPVSGDDVHAARNLP